MIKGFNRPTRKETFLLAFLISATIMGPVVFTLFGYLEITADGALTFVGTILSILSAAWIVVIQMKNSQTKNQKNIEHQWELERDKFIAEHRAEINDGFTALRKIIEDILELKGEIFPIKIDYGYYEQLEKKVAYMVYVDKTHAKDAFLFAHFMTEEITSPESLEAAKALAIKFNNEEIPFWGERIWWSVDD